MTTERHTTLKYFNVMLKCYELKRFNWRDLREYNITNAITTRMADIGLTTCVSRGNYKWIGGKPTIEDAEKIRKIQNRMTHEANLLKREKNRVYELKLREVSSENLPKLQWRSLDIDLSKIAEAIIVLKDAGLIK